MNSGHETRLDRLGQAGQHHLLRSGLKGLEKESLRMSPDGTLAQTPHPRALGSALTHPSITTDYSEALIELITPPSPDAATALGQLEDLHTFVYRHLGDEFLLANSMPCGIAGDDSIPIARYGTSNIGQMKHVYRRGLAYRYGRAMQVIAGLHFNYSVDEDLWPALQKLEGNTDPLAKFIADGYFGAVRNVHRTVWLPIYLFGSSPAVSKSFFIGREQIAAAFPEFDSGTLFRPYATSLRMSDIGYRNDSQASLDISFDKLDDYVASLTAAIGQPYPEYERIGVKVDGEYRQLNANILQIENEYYSSVRPKQVARSGEKPTLALKRRGVRYLELRCMDLGWRSPVGVGLDELRFLEIFMLYCVLADSPFLSAAEKAEASRNSLAVACCGRTPGFRLFRAGSEVPLKDWAYEILGGMRAVAKALDGHDPERPYARCLDAKEALIADPDKTPSALLLEEMSGNRESYEEYTLRLSRRHAATLRDRPLSAETLRRFARQAEESWEEQRRVEAADRVSFDEYIQAYFAQAGG
ncbi:glutamate--cysteine ligase [Methylomagnum ishizawai]|uniref:glutamate--cysteine ligase n=1 Tax=Methylomagnum ishizawai TaxID=1760988 RepID=UPI001C328AB9|nr:glutamate--cysteine ligase [Methylomagnum ishizawai]BBL75905.1 glutamate--cysteine ligase [Methylomagnum ishizawai]